MRRMFWMDLVTTAAVVGFVVAFMATREELTMPEVFGDKRVAMFDLWSFQHLLSGMLLGSVLAFFHGPIALAVLVAYGWEAPEWWMESGGFGPAVAVWKAGEEHWTNRLIADPGMVLLGARIGLSSRWVFWPALLLAATWLVVNIVAPDCMEVQRRLLAIVFD